MCGTGSAVGAPGNGGGVWGTPGTLVVGPCGHPCHHGGGGVWGRVGHPCHHGGWGVWDTMVFTLGTLAVNTLLVVTVAGGILGTLVGHTLAGLGATVSYH